MTGRRAVPELDDKWDYRYSIAPRAPRKPPTPGPDMRWLTIPLPNTEDTKATALRVLESHNALDLADMLGLESS